MHAEETTSDRVILKARYHVNDGTDVEYGQGAIERTELPHREIEPCVWLIAVPSPAEADVWSRKLNEAVDPKHGSFAVERATPEEQRRVDSGEITLQQ